MDNFLSLTCSSAFSVVLGLINTSHFHLPICYFFPEEGLMTVFLVCLSEENLLMPFVVSEWHFTSVSSCLALVVLWIVFAYLSVHPIFSYHF